MTPHTVHTLTDARGEVWNFKVHPAADTVIVVSPAWQGKQPFPLLYRKTFLRQTLEQLPQDAVMRLFEEARVFSRNYSPVIKPYEHDDWTRNTVEIGIRIRFTPETPSVVMVRKDARRLWGLLASAA
jgi:hypothetical protein